MVAAGMAAVTALGLGAVVLAGGVPRPGPGFATALVVSGGINVVTLPLVVYALKRSDISLVSPLTSLTPLFMLVTGVLVLGERASAAGGLGVAVIVAGAYLLNAPDRRAGVLAPFVALARDPGARAMLVVAFLWSVSATYDKVGTEASSPLAWAAAVHGVVALALVPAAARRLARNNRRLGRRAIGAILLAGALTAVAAAAQMTALTLTLAAYVIAVKRTSILFGVLLGHSWFHEAEARRRLLGAAIMLVGFVLLTLG